MTNFARKFQNLEILVREYPIEDEVLSLLYPHLRKVSTDLRVWNKHDESILHAFLLNYIISTGGLEDFIDLSNNGWKRMMPVLQKTAIMHHESTSNVIEILRRKFKNHKSINIHSLNNLKYNGLIGLFRVYRDQVDNWNQRDLITENIVYDAVEQGALFNFFQGENKLKASILNKQI